MSPTPPAAPPGLHFRGKLDPFITVAELAALLNQAANGKSAWTPDRLRPILIAAGAVQRAPERARPNQQRRTARRQYVTTRKLLAETMQEFHDAIFVALSDDEASRLVRELE